MTAPAPGASPARRSLTARQRAVLKFIRSYVSDVGYPPTMQEIGQAVGLSSSNSVTFVLASLQEKGYIRRSPKTPRGIQVIEP